MLERNFSSDFRKELVDILGDTAEVILLQDAPKSGKKPYDAYMTWRGWHISMEFKMANGASMPYTAPTERQKQCLRQSERAGGYGFIVVRVERLKQVLFITADTWEAIFDGGNVKSIGVDILERTCISHNSYYPEDKPIMIDRHKWFNTLNEKGKPIVATKWFFPLWLKHIDPSFKGFDYAL
jgi:penicillin-binding protein-related factor A (putative recombinase)